MNRGYLKLWRRSSDSIIFANEGLWKLFCLCLMKACHTENEIMIPGILKPIKLEPGQFLTGRYALHEDYHQAHLKTRYSRKAAPTAITLYRWLLNLQEMQILNINSYSKFSIITVINWYLYQSDEQQMNNRRTSDEHKQECNKNVKETPEKILSKINDKRKRYSEQNLIDRVFHSIATTRRSRKIKDSVLLAQLEAWEQYPVERVESGISIYLERDYAAEGKDEKYLLGIIRKHKPRQKDPTEPEPHFLTVREIEELRK